MTVLAITGFSGSAPAVPARLLGETACTKVVDADPSATASLRPMGHGADVAEVDGASQTIMRMGRGSQDAQNYWLAWPDVVDVALAQDAGGAQAERIFWTDGSAPQWSDASLALSGGPPYPQASRPLAVPAPQTAITASLTTNGEGSESYRIYTYTYFTDRGWESAPAPPSAALLIKAGAHVALSGMSLAPAGNYGIVGIRIYATQADTSSSAAYYLLREISPATDSEDTGQTLGEQLATVGWRPMPDDSRNLCALWNGMYAATSQNTLMFCEPYVPYAWPASYDTPLRDVPVALAAAGKTLFVLTDGEPLAITGYSPESLDQAGMGVSAPCAARLGVVSFSQGVAWPSRDGLAFSAAGGDLIVTRSLLTPKQWRALNPETMIAGRYGRFYACSFDGPSGREAFMVDPAAPGLGIWWLSRGWLAAWSDTWQGRMFVLGDAGGIAVLGGDDDAPAAQCLFESRHFEQQKPVNFGWARVVADAFPVVLDVVAGDSEASMATKFSIEVGSSKPRALPGGFREKVWAVKVRARSTVLGVYLATNVRELCS